MSMSDESFNKIMRLIAKNGMENEASALCNHEIAQREALARVEAELSDIRHKAFTAAMARDTAQAQLAEALALLKHVKSWFGWGDLPESLSKLDDFLARHAQAEQQEAQEIGPLKGAFDEAAEQAFREQYGLQEAQGAQASEFQREDRYIVIKRKDLGAVPLEVRESLGVALFQLSKHLPKRECLVIESDWPEYEPTWAAIQARMTGQGAQAVDERSAFEGALIKLARENGRTLDHRHFDRSIQTGKYFKAVLESQWATWQARAALATQPADSIAVNRLRLSLVAWDAELAEQDYQLTSDDLREKLRQIHGDIDRLMPEQGQAAVRGAEHE